MPVALTLSFGYNFENRCLLIAVVSIYLCDEAFEMQREKTVYFYYGTQFDSVGVRSASHGYSRSRFPFWELFSFVSFFPTIDI